VLAKRIALVLLSICVPLISLAQVDQFAIVTSPHPDFGAVNGNWGHFQFYRPFGVKGVVVDDWRDLTVISPLTGEPLNTDRQGWMPFKEGTTLWNQMHPKLTAPADTTAASTMVNYRQGDGVFKDFNLWYHNSLDDEIRWGWISKLRSHPRLAEITVYDEQRHRFQANSEANDQYFQIEAGYTHKVNPLYILAQDSALTWGYDDTPQIHSNRWDGSFEWNNLDSNAVGTELFAWVQGGIWSWSGGERKSMGSMAYMDHRFQLFGLGPAAVQLGVISKQYGGYKHTQQFAEFRLPQWSGKYHQLELGLRNLGKTSLFPVIHLTTQFGPFQAGYQTHQLIEERLWDSKISAAHIQELSVGLKLSHLSLSLNSWAGQDDGNGISGYSGEGRFSFPWQMSAMVGGAVLNKSNDWVFSEKYINWEVTQNIRLFDDALYTELKVWGKHLINTQLGLLDIDNFEVSNSIYPGEEILHLLNYTISGQVGTVLVSFTDQNVLHDDLWSQYATIPWNLEFSIMANQIPNYRFRYLSIIWTFDN